MDIQRIACALSQLFEQNRNMNFNISLTPAEVLLYLLHKVLFVRTNSMDPDSIRAAIFVTNDGECGFVASNNFSITDYKYLIQQLNNFVLSLPQELRGKLWCRVQNDNPVVQKLAIRLGFVKDQVTDQVTYFIYGGNADGNRNITG